MKDTTPARVAALLRGELLDVNVAHAYEQRYSCRTRYRRKSQQNFKVMKGDTIVLCRLPGQNRLWVRLKSGTTHTIHVWLNYEVPCRAVQFGNVRFWVELKNAKRIR